MKVTELFVATWYIFFLWPQYSPQHTGLIYPQFEFRDILSISMSRHRRKKTRRSCKFPGTFDTAIRWRLFICDSPRCSLRIPWANMFLYTDGMTENQNPICFVRGSFFTSIIKNAYCWGKLTLWPSNPTTTIQNPLRWNMFYLWHTKSNNWAIQSDLNLKTLSVCVFWQWTTFDSNFTPISRQCYRTFLSIQ